MLSKNVSLMVSISNMRIFVTQSLKWHLRGCLPREEVYQFLDNLWKPRQFFKLKLRNTRVVQFVDWLHRDRISLNRILKMNVSYEYPRCYVISLWFLSRRGNEYYRAYATRR